MSARLMICWLDTPGTLHEREKLGSNTDPGSSRKLKSAPFMTAV